MLTKPGTLKTLMNRPSACQPFPWPGKDHPFLSEASPFYLCHQQHQTYQTAKCLGHDPPTLNLARTRTLIQH